METDFSTLPPIESIRPTTSGSTPEPVITFERFDFFEIFYEGGTSCGPYLNLEKAKKEAAHRLIGLVNDRTITIRQLIRKLRDGQPEAYHYIPVARLEKRTSRPVILWNGEFEVVEQ